MEDKIQYKVVLKRDACIGALACSAIDPSLWENSEDGKVNIIAGEKVMEGDEIKEEYIILDELKDENMDGAMSCPVLAIEIYKLKNGEVIEKMYPQS
jgi:ferredoxin